MLISFDPEARALYIQLRDAKVHKTVEFAPETFVDLDSRGDLLGVEMLKPGRLAIRLLKKISAEYHAAPLRKIDPSYIPRAFAHS